MEQLVCNSPLIYSNPRPLVDGLFNGRLVEMPAILDSLFHKVVNTTSILIGMESGGWWGATK